MGFLVEDRLPPAYESEASLLVGPVSGDRDTLEAAGQQARTYAGVARTATIVTGAAQRVGLSAESLRSKLESVTASNITRILNIRARDSEALSRIFRQIDALEKTPVQVTRYTRYDEATRPLILLGLGALALELLVGSTLVVRVP